MAFSTLLRLFLLVWLMMPARADAPPPVPAAGADQPAPAPSATSPGPSPNITEMSFEDGLYLTQDRMFQGVNANEIFTFSVPKRWDLTTDPVLHLRFDHSAALLPDRSTVTVLVNGQAVGTVHLDTANTVGGELVAPLPRSLLTSYNKLEVQVVQHVGPECEDPFDPALWTRMSKRSTIVWTYEEHPFEAELGLFPYPIIDPTDWRAVDLALAGPDPVDPAQLTALTWIAAALGRQADWRHVHFLPPVTDPAKARSNLLVLGTPAANPLISTLLGPVSLPAGQGLVAELQNPANPTLGILVVAGADAEGLRRAAQALGGEDRAELLVGSRVTITSIAEPSLPHTKQNPLPAPADNKFTLATLGFEDTTVRGFYAKPVELQLRLEGDSHVHVNGATVDVQYSYGAQLDTRLSTLEVKLNGVSLRSVALNKPEGEEHAQLRVALPFELLDPTSTLEFVFHLFPLDFDPCRYISDRQIWGTIHAASELDIARDHYAMVPDLSLLRHDLWPLGLAMGSGGVLVVVPEHPTGGAASAAGQLIAELGRVSTTPKLSLDLQPATEDALSQHAGRETVILTDGSANAAYTALERDHHLTASGDVRRLLQTPGHELLSADVAAPFGTIEQIVNPTDDQHTVLLLRAASSDALMGVVSTLGDAASLYRLKGNIAVVAPGQDIKTLDVAEKHQIGHVSAAAQVYGFLRSHWVAVGLGAIVGALLIGRLTRTWASRRAGQAE